MQKAKGKRVYYPVKHSTGDIRNNSIVQEG